MNGKVCISERIKKAYAVHRWNTCTFSCETPVTSVTQLALLAVALRDISTVDEYRYTPVAYKTNGIHARASHPDLVANGGEPPYMSVDQ